MNFRAAIRDKSSPKTMIPFDSARHVHQSTARRHDRIRRRVAGAGAGAAPDVA